MQTATTSNSKQYEIQEEDFIVFGDAILRAMPMLLNDRVGIAPRKAVEEYFNRGFSIFVNRLEYLKNSKAPLTPRHEKELLFMLDALISAKRMLEEA